MSKMWLTINGGSSSLKFALFAADGSQQRLFSGIVERIGQAEAFFSVQSDSRDFVPRESAGPLDHTGAARRVAKWLEQTVGRDAVTAIGHRVVHGSEKYEAAHRIDAALLEEIRRLAPLMPQHLPAQIALIEFFAREFPHVPQVASFDTAFHSHLPRVARLVPIPRRYAALGVRRYGFHGLSYTYLMSELRRVAPPAEADGRVVLAHLGNGASLAAVRQGRSIDTSMGFTATAGLVMGTRSGDLDPGVITWLLRRECLSADALDELLNRQSGLAGISETGSDMRDLLARAAHDERAEDAVALFCYQVKKWIGAFAAALGGLDSLVFSGGIGENAAPIRARICDGLDFLGVRLDQARNAAHAAVISPDGAAVAVRMIRTDEELTMVSEIGQVLHEVQA